MPIPDPPDEAEEAQLFKDFRAGRVSASSIVERYLHLAESAVPFGVRDREDHVQNAVVLLYSAINGFDPERDTRFSTYSQYWLRSLKPDQLVRIPRWMRKLVSKIQRGCEIPPETSESAIRNANRILNQSTGPLPDTLEMDEPAPDVRDKIKEMLDTRLTAREARMVRARYLEEKTLSVIAEEEEVSVETVRQVVSRGVRKLHCGELEELL